MSVIRFDHVSKGYRLGLTRTSLPALASSWLRARFSNRPARSAAAGEWLWALHEVDFTLERGRSLALIGPNGAGKTTILKLLARITEPTIGRVEVKGRLSALIELGAGFHPDLTGRDNVFLNGAILGMDRAALARRFDEIVDFSGLERFIDTPVKRYSSGMVVRLGFAVASCIEPDVLLVDEVLAVGDATFAQKCLARIRTLVDGGTTLLFVSHNLYLAKAACADALYLRGGRVVLGGSTDDVIRAYERDLHEQRAARFAGRAGPAPGGDGEIDIVSVELLGGEGTPAPAVFGSGEPMLVRVGYDAFADLGRVQVSAFVRRSDGLICCMARTRLDDVCIDIRRGRGTVSLRFDRLQLIGGSYYVEAFVLNEGDSLALTPRGAQSDWFAVSGRAISSTDDSGVYEPLVRWAHEPAAAEPALVAR